MNKKTNSGLKIICLNRKASFSYFFEDLLEAGIVLKGSEIKSITTQDNTLVEDGDNFAYLRPETAQQIFTNFKNILYEAGSWGPGNEILDKKHAWIKI